MAGNNDEKIVRLPQLDRLTKSLDARNSTIIQNVHDELISAVEDVEKKLFSKDYNDLINKPCYAVSELKLYTNDGDNTGRLIVNKGTTNVKFAKISEDEIDSNSMDQANFSMFVGDEGYEISDPSTFIIVENETGSAINLDEYVVCTFNDNFAMDMSGTIVTFPEKGLYFSFNASGSHAWRLDNVYLPIVSVKQLDEKFIPDTIARMDDIIELEEDNLSMEGLIDETYPSLVTQDKTILGAINELARMLNGLTLMPITQEAYDALTEKDPNVIYIIAE